MCIAKLLLKMQRSWGHHQENIKLTTFSQFEKVYFKTHDTINNPSKKVKMKCMLKGSKTLKDISKTILNNITKLIRKTI